MLSRPAAAFLVGLLQGACTAVDDCQAYAGPSGTGDCTLYGALLTRSSAGVPDGFNYYGSGSATGGSKVPTKGSFVSGATNSRDWTCWVKDAPQGERGRGGVFHPYHFFQPQYVVSY